MTARQARQSGKTDSGDAGPAHDGAARPSPSDEDLVAAVHNGDSAALSTLLTRYQDRLYAVALRMVSNPETAADLTQDAMVKIIQGLGSWDGRAALSTWMIRVTMNVTLSYLRGQKLRRHASIEGIAERQGRSGGGASRAGAAGAAGRAGFEQDRELGGPSSVQLNEQRERLGLALAALEPEQRAILILRDVQDLDYEQIAAVLEVAVGTVKSRLFRARAALRQALENLGPRQGSARDNPD